MEQFAQLLESRRFPAALETYRQAMQLALEQEQYDTIPKTLNLLTDAVCQIESDDMRMGDVLNLSNAWAEVQLSGKAGQARKESTRRGQYAKTVAYYPTIQEQVELAQIAKLCVELRPDAPEQLAPIAGQQAQNYSLKLYKLIQMKSKLEQDEIRLRCAERLFEDYAAEARLAEIAEQADELRAKMDEMERLANVLVPLDG